MKTAIIVCMSVLLTSVVSAEIYSWEDENGINFTDDASSVPEKYREKFFKKAETQPLNSSQTDKANSIQPVKVKGIQAVKVKSIKTVKARVLQQNPGALQDKKGAALQSRLERKRSAAEAAKQKQIRIREFQNTLETLAFYIEVMVLLGFILFMVWIITIADIVRSEFITPSYKTAWLLLVLLLPLVGVLPYIFYGANHKSGDKEVFSSPDACHSTHCNWPRRL